MKLSFSEAKLLGDVYLKLRIASDALESIRPAGGFTDSVVGFCKSCGEPAPNTAELAATDSQHTQLAIVAREIVQLYRSGCSLSSSILPLIERLELALQQQAGA